MNDDDLTRFHYCGIPMRPCRGCGEARCLACDLHRPERECGSGPLLLGVATA